MVKREFSRFLYDGHGRWDGQPDDDTYEREMGAPTDTPSTCHLSRSPCPSKQENQRLDAGSNPFESLFESATVKEKRKKRKRKENEKKMKRK